MSAPQITLVVTLDPEKILETAREYHAEHVEVGYPDPDDPETIAADLVKGWADELADAGVIGWMKSKFGAEVEVYVRQREEETNES